MRKISTSSPRATKATDDTMHNHDELRRQVRESQRAHEQTLPVLGAALDRAFDPDAGVSEADKARLLGVPDRRGFLKIGGLTVGLGALAAACVYPDKPVTQVAQTGTMIPAPATSVPPFPGSVAVDATLLMTALSIEKLAIETYQAALDGSWLTTGAVVDVAKHFRDQHKDHADALVPLIRSYGQDPDSVQANAYVKDKVVTPAAGTIAGELGNKTQAETDTLKVALDLEDIAAQLYTRGGGRFTTTVLRQAATSIGAIEAAHYTVLAGALGKVPVPFAFEKTAPADAPEDAYVKPDESKLPKAVATTTGSAAAKVADASVPSPSGATGSTTTTAG